MSTKILRSLILIAVILLIALAGFFAYKYFLKPNRFRIENKYYRLELQTPKGWTALQRTFYSEDKIAKGLAECKNNKVTNQLGEFKFESQKYPGDLSGAENNFLSGAILDVAIKCTGDSLQYVTSQDFYISPSDKASEQLIKQKYTGVLDKIIASIKFIK